MNKDQNKKYLLAIITATLMGCIFPAFSFIITQLCSITTDIKYAETS